MKRFTITIEEMISKNFEVDADTAEEAMRIAEQKYQNCEFLLAPGCLVAKQMAIMLPENEVTEWIEF